MSATAVDGHGELVEQLDLLVREAVRRQGVDPQRDAPVVRRIAEGVVRDHDERSLTGAVTPVPDAAAVVGELVARVSGFGPLQPFLDDPAVEEVWINDPSRVFVARHGRHELTNLILTRAQVDELVERMLKSSGRRIDLSRPFVDAMLPEGHRLHVVLEGISRGFTAVNIRKFVLKAARLSDLVELGSLTPAAAAFLEASVRAGLNVLVAGGTQAGKDHAAQRPAGPRPATPQVVNAPPWQMEPKPALIATPNLKGAGMPVAQPLAFILMPFDADFEEVYTELIQKPLADAGFTVRRADSLLNQRNILQDVVRGIAQAELIVADVSGLNPNVMYEVGLAHAMGKRTVMITQDIDELPFDFRTYRANEYSVRFTEASKSPTLCVTSLVAYWPMRSSSAIRSRTMRLRRWPRRAKSANPGRLGSTHPRTEQHPRRSLAMRSPNPDCLRTPSNWPRPVKRALKCWLP